MQKLLFRSNTDQTPDYQRKLNREHNARVQQELDAKQAAKYWGTK